MASKLFIPGPTEVRKEILDELSNPQIGHRTGEFRELFGGLKPGLRKLFYTKNDVLVSTSSGSGFWEGAVRNCVNKKVLHAVNGFFSKKWASVSESCGKSVGKIEFAWGKPVLPAAVDEALSTGEYDSFCMVHNETSTGVKSDLPAISDVMKKYPQVIWIVDAVSSLAGTKIEVDKLGIDICLASSQKALALPAGIAVASISTKAYKRAESVNGRGYYFDFVELKKAYDKDETPYTPSIPHIYALRKQLQRIEEEGLDKRFDRHTEMALFVRAWALRNGFKMFSEEESHSDTVSCIANTRKLDFKAIKKEMAKNGYSIDSGYGKMNEKLEAEGKVTTFRIAHMGDLTFQEVKEMCEQMENYF